MVAQVFKGNIDRQSIYFGTGLQFLFGLSLLGLSWIFSPDIFADTPFIATNLGMTVSEGGEGNFSGTLEAVDADTDPSSLVYTITTLPVHGQIKRGGNILGDSDSFTQEDINNSVVTYGHSGGENLSGFNFDDIMFFNLSDDNSTLADLFFVFSVAPLDDSPSITSNVSLNLLEGHDDVITAGNLRIDDPDTLPNDLIYTLVTIPTQGVLSKKGIQLGMSDSFTQTDIFDGAIRYHHDGSEVHTDSFNFDIQDQTTISSGNVFEISIAPVDDPPVIIVNAGVALSQGEEVVISNAALEASDSDTLPSQLIFTLVSLPSYGTIVRDGASLAISDSFSQSDINNGLVKYQHDGSEEYSSNLPFNDYFFFNLSDGTTTIYNNFFGEQVVFSVIFKNGFEVQRLALLY